MYTIPNSGNYIHVILVIQSGTIGAIWTIEEVYWTSGIQVLHEYVSYTTVCVCCVCE